VATKIPSKLRIVRDGAVIQRCSAWNVNCNRDWQDQKEAFQQAFRLSKSVLSPARQEPSIFTLL
jgi:hypothetical protein